MGVDKGGVGRCDAGGAGSGLYLAWAPYRAWVVGENELAEANKAENVGAGEIGGAV